MKRILRKAWNVAARGYRQDEGGVLSMDATLDIWAAPSATQFDILEAAPRLGDPVDLGLEDGGPPLYLLAVRIEKMARSARDPHWVVRCTYQAAAVEASPAGRIAADCEYCGRPPGEGETCSGCGSPRKIPTMRTDVANVAGMFGTVTETAPGTIAGNFASFFNSAEPAE